MLLPFTIANKHSTEGEESMKIGLEARSTISGMKCHFLKIDRS